MIYPEYDYMDVAVGNVNLRNKVQRVSKFKSPKGEMDCYRTWFRFGEDYLRHFKRIKTVRGYDGKCYCDFIPIDIDNEDLNISWQQTKQFIELLRIDYEFEPLHLFFSGSKGFHIYLPTVAFGNIVPSEDLNKIAKKICFDIADDIVLDGKIYDKNRLFRITNTINSKSGMYKIPLMYSQFDKGINHILKLADKPQKNCHPDITDYVRNPQFAELYKKHKSEVKPSGLTKKLTSGVPQGDRNNTCASYAGLLHSKGIDKELAHVFISGWNRDNSPPLSDSEIKQTLDSIYQYKVQADTEDMSKDLKTVWSLHDEIH